MQWERHWYRSSYTWLALLLLPLSWLFRFIVWIRRFCYHFHLKKIQHFSVPVIVVGNIAVGGTGKTPFVIWLSKWLQKNGFRPGIVSRGYGGVKQFHPVVVTSSSVASEVGDEPILLARQANCPVVVCVDRVLAVQQLLSTCDVVIADDGLQHYRLGRQIEIALVDGMREWGNGALLPAGPLREPVSRLQTVNFVVTTEPNKMSTHTMQLVGNTLVSLRDSTRFMSVGDFQKAFPKVHAVAGIGNPERFFVSLRGKGLDVVTHPFPDHYVYEAADLDFHDELPVIMTEKDAVKCEEFCRDNIWFLPVEAEVSDGLGEKILAMLRRS